MEANVSQKEKDVRVDIAVSPQAANGVRDAAVRNQNQNLLAKVWVAKNAKINLTDFVEKWVDVPKQWMVILIDVAVQEITTQKQDSVMIN